MDSANATSQPITSHHAHRARLVRWIAVAVAGALYAALLASHMGAWAGGADSSGYLNNARLMREGRFHVAQRAIEGLPSSQVSSFTYIPLGFIPRGAEQMVPTYPVGLSLFMVAVSPFTGWSAAPHVTVWLHALAGVALVFALGRMAGLGDGLALLGALILAVSPLYMMMSLQAMSDMPALVWCTAAVLCAWRGRQRDRWALTAGWCVAIAVLVRPSNLLIMAPVALCLGGNWRRWLWLILGGVPGAAFQALLNHNLYGSALMSGYGQVGGIFAWENMPLALVEYARWLPVILTPGIAVVFALPWMVRRESWRLIAVLAIWMVIFPAFYGFYLHTHEDWWYQRFLMPSFPPAIVAMLLAARMWYANTDARWSRVAGGIAAVAIVGWSAFWGGRLHVLSAGYGERVYKDASAWVQARLPANAVLAAMQTSGALFHYTNHTVVRYDQFNPAKFNLVERACATAGRPIYAVLFPFEIAEVLERRLPGHWTQIGAVDHATIWRRDGAEPSNTPPIPWTSLATARVAGMDVTANGVAGWSATERDRKHLWAWSSGTGVVELHASARETPALQLDFFLRSLAPCVVTVKQNGAILWRSEVGPTRSPGKVTVALADGQARLEFSTDTPGTRESAAPNSRVLAFAIYDPRLSVPAAAR
jgi:hypothetical protein